MINTKKLIFVPVFLIFFVILLLQLSPILKSYDFIFSLSLNTLMALMTISFLIMLVSLSFVLFATFALDWKLILGAAALVSLIPLLFFDPASGLVLGVGIFVSFILVYVTLENKMKSYLTFQPNALLGPSIRHLSSFLILVLALVYFLTTSRLIADKGFQIPDSLIDTAINLSTDRQSPKQTETPQLSIPALQDATNNLKSVSSQASLIKQTIKDQFQNFLKPYLSFIPAILALLLFLTLQGLTSFINLLIYPLIWMIFYILEKSGFIKFTSEMRAVKKMVI